MRPGAAPLPPLHVVTDDAVAARPGFGRAAAEVLAAGGGALMLHLRLPAGSGRRVFELALRLAEVARAHGALLAVNDRLDAALAAGAHAVQLGARGLAAADAQRVAAGRLLVGVSLHPGEAVPAQADFVLAGNVFATASHPGRPGAGPAWLRGLRAGVPVVAIGGVSPERVAAVRGAGAAGVAVVRGVWHAERPAAAVARYLEAWHA